MMRSTSDSADSTSSIASRSHRLRIALIAIAGVALVSIAWWSIRPSRSDHVRPPLPDQTPTIEPNKHIVAPPAPPVQESTDPAHYAWPNRGPAYPVLGGYPGTDGLWDFDPRLKFSTIYATKEFITYPGVSIQIAMKTDTSSIPETGERGRFDHAEDVDRRWMPVPFFIHISGKEAGLGSHPNPSAIARAISFRLFVWKQAAKAREASPDSYRVFVEDRGTVADLRLSRPPNDPPENDYQACLGATFETSDPELCAGVIVALEAYLDVPSITGKSPPLVVRSLPYPFRLITSSTDDQIAEAYAWKRATLLNSAYLVENETALQGLYLDMLQRWQTSVQIHVELGHTSYHLHREEEALRYWRRGLELLDSGDSDEPGSKDEVPTWGKDRVERARTMLRGYIKIAEETLRGQRPPWSPKEPANRFDDNPDDDGSK